MSARRLRLAAILLAGTLGLSACAYGSSYGYGRSYGSRYCDPYWDDCYGSAYYDPWYGWYGDYYYPGIGFYVFDRWGRRYRWSDDHRRYWEGRRHRWGDRNWDDRRWERWDHYRDDGRRWRDRRRGDDRDWRRDRSYRQEWDENPQTFRREAMPAPSVRVEGRVDSAPRPPRAPRSWGPRSERREAPRVSED
ncbi:MAG TPA: hypothetical protein VHM92_10970 [Allosphingosinicella sp.]|nr:hypothetical protein [Allosphingosinicella sp.]